MSDDLSHLYVSNVDGSEGRRIFSARPGIVWEADWSPGGRSIAFVQGDFVDDPGLCGLHAQIFTIDPSGRRVRGLTSSGANLNPVWSPDGKTIAFFHISRPAKVTLDTMAPDGSDKHEIAQVDAPCFPIEMGLDWSPTGNAFALVELMTIIPGSFYASLTVRRSGGSHAARAN